MCHFARDENARLKKAEAEMKKSYYEEKDAHTKLKQAEQHKSDQLAKARAELKSMKEKAEAARKLKQFQVQPAAARHSVCLADRPVRAGHDRQGQREQRAIAPLPDRQPGCVRLLRPHDGGGCAQSLGMKDAFVPSSVLRLRRRLSEDKMINIDIADVLFAGMVFPVMKFVKKIVLPRVRKAWEKVKEVAKKMACTEAPPVSDLESQSESNGSTDDLDHA